jgi:hypothetical protein
MGPSPRALSSSNEASAVSGCRLARRTVLTVAFLPSPQKNRSPPWTREVEVPFPGGIVGSPEALAFEARFKGDRSTFPGGIEQRLSRERAKLRQLRWESSIDVAAYTPQPKAHKRKPSAACLFVSLVRAVRLD